MTEEERYVWPNNKLIALSSASYKFEYMYKLYSQFENLIFNQGSKDTAHTTIMQFSYDCAPKQLYDQNLINQAKATTSIINNIIVKIICKSPISYKSNTLLFLYLK